MPVVSTNSPTVSYPSIELIPPGPRSRVGSIQLNGSSSAYCPNVTYLLFGGREVLFCVLVWDTRRKQRKTLQQQEERERRALAEFILRVDCHKGGGPSR